MSVKKFTYEEIMQLRSSPYVLEASPNQVHFSAEFKEKFGKQIYATPKKMGAETAEANMNAGLAAAQQICDYFAMGCTKFKVN